MLYKMMVRQNVGCVLQGDAVFWYNLKRSGQGDYDTEHAACPVLCGNKWGEWTGALYLESHTDQ